MSKQEDNRAKLEDRIVQLESQLAGLRPAPKPALNFVAPEGTRIIQEPPPFIRPADFPTKSQLDSLLQIVLSAYPKLGSVADTHEYKDHFERAFLGLCHIRRRPEVDKQRTMTFWRDYAQDILSGLRTPANLNLAPFVAAVVAHGDVSHTHPFHELNISMSAGLFFGGGTEGKVYSGAWKKVFESGQVGRPVEIALPMRKVRVLPISDITRPAEAKVAGRSLTAPTCHAMFVAMGMESPETARKG